MRLLAANRSAATGRSCCVSAAARREPATGAQRPPRFFSGAPLLPQPQSRRSANLAVAASAKAAKSIDMPDGLRAPPYTGSATQADAVRRLLERSGSLVGDIDEETAIWVR